MGVLRAADQQLACCVGLDSTKPSLSVTKGKTWCYKKACAPEVLTLCIAQTHHCDCVPHSMGPHKHFKLSDRVALVKMWGFGHNNCLCLTNFPHNLQQETKNVKVWQ